MINTIFITFWILPWLGLLGDPVKAQRWSGVLNESLDEVHDAEIFRAVVDSMRQWESHKQSPHRTKREASRVCYEDVGCFEDTGPFSYLEMLPSPPKDVGTRFYIYGTRKARSVPMEVAADDINDKANNAIDPNLPTKVIVHGFGSGCDHVWVYEMRSALMAVHECNIVCVDWSLGSALPNYVRAAANTRLVGRQLANLIRNLNVPLEKVHLIGFSLGAHVAGFAGAELANISRITGLDPAGPLFEAHDPIARLDKTDATFVDVIHSNGEQLILGGLGSWDPMGHVDFYPNGGRMQTGCSNIFLGVVTDIIWSGSSEGRSLCNHRRAYKLFTDSISRNCKFPAFPCESGYEGFLKGECFSCGASGSCGDMGYYSDASAAQGRLYLVTREDEPFCAHQYQIKVYNSRGERPARSYGKLQVTLIGENSLNETFTMTRRDNEELLVGEILQKIVVPHPAIINFGNIELKYTAYSGWISSGPVSWNIDKVSILDSFGKSLSVCIRGLTLESGKPAYLPLYPNDCNIPLDLDNRMSTNNFTTRKSAAMQMEPDKSEVEDKLTRNIGPFTKEQNFERNNDFPPQPEVASSAENPSQKVHGPFTKNQNVHLSPLDESVEISFVPKDGEEILSSTESKKSDSSPWSYVDVSDAGSNSLENTETESGRAFSGTSFVPSGTSGTPVNSPDTTTTEFVSEVQEPVLQMTKKETGRSMRHPEITEPILRPRSTRQNFKADGSSIDARQDDLQESSSSTSPQTSRGFTVQFLPERLVGIFAKAERYARQTLLPLISQYTPSFMSSARQDRVKYFPPLTDIDEDHPVTHTDGYIVDGVFSSTGNTERSNEIETSDRHISDSKNSQISNNSSRSGKAENLELDPARKNSAKTEGLRQLESFETVGEAETDSGSKSTEMVSMSQPNDWIPIDTSYPSKLLDSQRSARNSSRSSKQENYGGKWMSEGGDSWNSPVEDKETIAETKIDDWVPIVDKKKDDTNTEATTNDGKNNSVDSETTLTTESIISSTSPEATDNTKTSLTTNSNEESTSARSEKERKFIPLVDFENRDQYLASTDANDVTENLESNVSSSTESSSHIQKIQGSIESRTEDGTSANRRSIVFPYAYERKKDPRTRYIPLLPENEMRKSTILMDREH